MIQNNRRYFGSAELEAFEHLSDTSSDPSLHRSCLLGYMSAIRFASSPENSARAMRDIIRYGFQNSNSDVRQWTLDHVATSAEGYQKAYAQSLDAANRTTLMNLSSSWMMTKRPVRDMMDLGQILNALTSQEAFHEITRILFVSNDADVILGCTRVLSTLLAENPAYLRDIQGLMYLFGQLGYNSDAVWASLGRSASPEGLIGDN